MVAGGGLTSALQFFWVSPSEASVMYLADQDVNDVFELYRAHIGVNAAPEKVNGPLVSGGDVYDFEFVPDGSKRVVYLADQLTDNQIELFTTSYGRRRLPPSERSPRNIGPLAGP